MQTTKRLLALLLCAVMLFTAVPVEAFATGEDTSDGTVVTEPTADETESTGAPSETEAEAETSAPEEVTEEPAPSEEEATEAPTEETEEVTEPEEEAELNALSDGDVVSVTHDGIVTGYASLQEAFDGFAPSNNTYGGTYVVTLLGDTTGVSKNLQYPTSVLNITLDLNGHTITGNGTNIAVNINMGSNASGVSSGTFTITDSVGGGKITGGKGGVYVYGKNATFNFQGGTITGNHGASKGGGILVGATTFFNMTGGTITGNSVTGTSSANTGLGGGVCVNYGSITGGAIYGNTANAGSHLQTGRGGGVCTEITRTTGYSTLTIANGVVFGNTAGNAGDDVMAQGNGNVKFTLVIGTENWYVDGWKGTKAGTGGGQTDRYSAENPVAYTDGGFTDVKNVTVGLKYVVSSTEPEEPVAPEAPYYTEEGTNVEGIVLSAVCKDNAEDHVVNFHYTNSAVTSISEVAQDEAGNWTCTVTFDTAPYVVAYNDVQDNFEGYVEHRLADAAQTSVSVTLVWDAETEKWVVGEAGVGIINLVGVYTVTYTDGVEDEEVFADQTYTVENGAATPAFNGEPTREGYTFTGWDPEVAETVTGNATYSAQWEKIPVYVARLESTGVEYETLQAALDAAKTALAGDLDADKITLLDNTTECVKLAWTRSNGNMTLTIDLNGYTVTGDGTASVMVFQGLTSSNGRFSIVIEDSSEAKTGTITGGNATSGGAIKLDGAKSGDSLTINGGNFVNNTASSNGGAIYSAVIGAKVTINGGTFTGNTAKSGGAINAYTLTINGGVITGNTANGDATYTGRGGGICMWSTGALTLNITGGQIYGNTANRYGDDIVICSSNNTVSLNMMDAAEMGVEGIDGWYIDGYNGAPSYEANMTARHDPKNAVEFTGTLARGTAVALKAAQGPEKYTVTYTDGVEDEVVFEDQTYTVVEGEATPAFNGEPTREGYTFTGWDPAVAETVTGNATYSAQWEKIPVYVARLESTGEQFETLQAAINAAQALMVDANGAEQTVTILADITESCAISWTCKGANPSKVILNIDLNGHTVTGNGGSVFTVRRNGSYTAQLHVVFKDSVGTGVVTGGTGTVNGSNTYGGAIYAIGGSSYVTIEGGTWTGNTATHGGVYAGAYTNNTNYITINGGTLSGNTATGNGGAIYGRYAFINGGTITGNSAASGGGVYVFIAAATKLEMTGGAVYGNTATTDGDDIIWRANKGTSSTAGLKLIAASEMGNGLTGWYEDNEVNRFSADNAVEFTSYAKYFALNTRIALKAAQVLEKYTVTYTDGVDGVEIFADQTYTVEEGSATPAFVSESDPVREGYTFGGWTPAVAETVTGDVTYTAVWVPNAPDKLGKNVTDQLLTIICDTDEDHAALTGKWYSTSCKVYPSNSQPVWNEELGTWTIGIRLQSLSVMYVDQLKDTYNDIWHDLVGDTVIETTLKWDAAQELWVPTEAIEVHGECRTVPMAPTHKQLRSYQIQVMGDLDGDGVYGENGLNNDGVWEMFATSIPEGSYVIGEVKGSREEGFTVDITVTLADGDIFITNWIEKRTPGEEYFYNWDMTQQTITYTLTYNGDLNGTLYGDRHASNTNYDWIIGFNNKNETVTYGAVGQAYVGKYVDVVYTDGVEGEEVFADQTYSVMTGKATPAFEGTPTREGYTFAGWTPEVAETVTGPATYTATWTPNAPKQDNVVEDLVTVICDSDPDRHAPVTGKWYPQHCSTTSDIVWNEELGTWTVDIRIGSLYIMYVDQLEDANGGTEHELVEDVTTVYGTLKWDAEQALWVPVEPIELHTTCRTAPIAPNFDQINGYQVKVKGDMDGDGVYGEATATNDGVREVWTTSIPENGYVLSEVYGSREEGFFVDVTVTIENGDAYITNWIENCDPGAEYVYDFEKTPATVTFTLRYNGSLTGTLHGDRHASNTNYDWILVDSERHYGVIAEGYVDQVTYPVRITIYRNGNTTAPYAVFNLENLAKGEVIDLSALDINDYYSSRLGFEFEGWFNDGLWNQYKAGKEVAGLDEITVNGWTNIICMVTDYQTVQIQIYRNGNTTDVYKTITLDKMLKGDVLDLTTLDINDYYSSTYGFVFEGWFNDGKWNQYKAGQDVSGMDEITINGWTNVICMVTDNQKIVVKAVTNGDKDNAEVIFNGAAPKGENLVEWLNENVEVPEKEGYTVDMWYNWDWYGHKFGENTKVSGWTNVYVTYTANEYTVSYNTNGGPEAADKVVTFGAKYGVMPTSSITGLSSRKTDWYLVDEEGNVTDINIRNTSVVSVARDHELFLMRDVLAPTLKITLTVPGGLSDSYKYYDGNNRVLTVTVNNMNEEVLDYTYQWYKDDVLIEGATEAVLTLDGNVSDSGTYKVVVTATLKDGSEIVVNVDSASAEKTQKVQIMYAANTLRLNENYGENPVTSDSYWGSDVGTIRSGATREGYTFGGWNTMADGSGETYQVGDEVAFPGANGNGGVVLELYAQWTANEYTVSYNTNGGPAADSKVVTFGAKYGVMPTSSITGLSSRKTDWYLVDEEGNITDINIRNTTVVSVARDHELFLMRDVLAPTLKITLEVPGAISDDYKYYVPGNSTRVLTVTVNNMNEEVLDYTYQWYKDDVLIEGATEAVLTLDGNVSDSGTYKVVVTATLKDGSEIVVNVDTASGEKSLAVKIMHVANTLKYDANGGEDAPGDHYTGGATITVQNDEPVRVGYTFTGWNTAADGSGDSYLGGDTYTFANDNGNGGCVDTLYAQWKAIELKVYYYIDGELVNEFVLSGEAVTAVNVYDYMPEKAGYTLTCWYEKAADIGNPAKAEPNAEQDLTNKKVIRLYGSYKPITYRIKYAGGEGAEYVGDLPSSKDDWVIVAGYPYGEEITLHDGTGFQRTGYTLTGWVIKGKTYALGATAEGSFTTVQNGMITATAVWEANTYTLILDANGGEFVMPLAEDSEAVTTLEIPVTFGQAIGELPTPVREGYTFAGWVDAEGNAVTADTVYNTVGNMTITAEWTPNTYEVTLDANGGELEDSTIEVTYGEPIGELPTPTRDGYTFAGWVDADGNKVDADTVYDVADDITLIATWTANKPADPSSPPTGDGMTMFFMASMLISAAALLLMMDRKRRMAA